MPLHAQGIDHRCDRAAGVRFSFSHAAPLFEEERYSGRGALISKGKNPLLLHWSCSWSAFPADDSPADSGKIKATEMFEKRLDGKKSYARRRRLQLLDPRQAVLFVLDANAPPDVLVLGSKAQSAAEQVAQSPRPLRQHLKRMPVGRCHHATDHFDIVVRNAFVKEVAHRVHEHKLWRAPEQGLR